MKDQRKFLNSNWEKVAIILLVLLTAIIAIIFLTNQNQETNSGYEKDLTEILSGDVGYNEELNVQSEKNIKKLSKIFSSKISPEDFDGREDVLPTFS